MADINVNWGAAPVPQDYTAAALEGAQAGQAQRGISALQGIDLNDPDSLNKGIGNLVRAGAADQASALMGLQIQRSALQGLPALFAKLGALNDPPQSAPTAAAPPQGPTTQGQPPAPPTGQPDTAALAQVNGQMAQDAKAYSQTPPDQQSALAANLKQKYMAMGFPEPSIDAALAHAATPGGAGQLAAHYDAHSQLLSGGQPDQAALAPPGGTYAWASKLLGDPGLQASMQFYKKYGIDTTGLIDTAKGIEAPTISKNAEIVAAPTLGAIAAQTAGKTTTAEEQAKAPFGLDTVTLPNGETAQVPHNMALTLGASGALHGLTPEAEAQQRSAGAAAGGAPYDLVHLTGPNGEDIQVTKAQMAAMGAHGGLPTGPGIPAKANMEGQATALNAASTQAGDRLTQYPASIARGQALQGIANTVGTGAYTDALKNIAQYIPGATPQKYATNAGLLAQDLHASFKDALGGLPVPRVTSEAKAITGAIPAATSPQDQVKLYAAMNLAATQYHQAYDQFITNWTQSAANDPSKANLAAANAAWAAGPGAQSLFAMPALKGVTIGGEPAVQPHTFQGHTYLIPLHGLLGKNATPIKVN